MSTFILVDVHNLFHRSKHVTKGDTHLKTGMAVNIMFNSLNKLWKKFEGTHVVMALDSRSWRRDYFENYKKTRRIDNKLKSSSQKEEDEIFIEALNNFIKFCKEKTNVTVIGEDGLEADDIIAGWIDYHPDDQHIILSSDTDFIQLLDKNVIIYDGVRGQTIRIDGYFDEKDRPVLDKKKQKNKVPRNPEYELFLKCIRGDSTDGIFSAYPGVRETKIKKAFEDRHEKSFDWNNLMQQTWIDKEGNEHRVLDDFKFNKRLIDLRNQPEHVRQNIYQTIHSCCFPKNKKQVGVWFLSFCDEWELERQKQNPEKIAQMLQADYPNKEN